MSFLFVKEIVRNDPKPYDKLERCQANYRNQCDESTPYICSDGLLKGDCSADPNIWQYSRMCNRFCDTRKCPDVSVIPPKKMFFGIRNPEIVPNIPQTAYVLDTSKQIKCPRSIPKLCNDGSPFQCLRGTPTGGCSANPQTWQNYYACKNFCDVRGYEDDFYY